MAEKCNKGQGVRVQRVNREIIKGKEAIKEYKKKPEKMPLRMMRCTEKAYRGTLADLTCLQKLRSRRTFRFTFTIGPGVQIAELENHWADSIGEETRAWRD